MDNAIEINSLARQVKRIADYLETISKAVVAPAQVKLDSKVRDVVWEEVDKFERNGFTQGVKK